MVIAVNTRFLLAEYLEGYGNFVYETFKRITEWHPEHAFVFIFDRPVDKKFVFGPNVTTVTTGPPARHPLLWKFWYDVRKGLPFSGNIKLMCLFPAMDFVR
ncbi:MAG: hypothetical protein IPO53_05610 [Chitinophagaceae bacterium]|nr:hypothetical protein [Chitinophagaceae bacterium]